MACGMSSCGIMTGGFEGFENSEVKSSCPAKEMMGNCSYTCQGMFVCNKPTKESDKGVAKNIDMAQEFFRDIRPFADAAPWTN